MFIFLVNLGSSFSQSETLAYFVCAILCVYIGEESDLAERKVSEVTVDGAPSG